MPDTLSYALSWRRMDSRSVFVVQRTFGSVRRGYDPDEVDRHLELVSEMFNRGLAGERRKEAERLAEEARGAKLEAEATLEGARLKVDADLAAARAEAAAIREAARAEGVTAAEAE